MAVVVAAAVMTILGMSGFRVNGAGMFAGFVKEPWSF